MYLHIWRNGRQNWRAPADLDTNDLVDSYQINKKGPKFFKELDVTEERNYMGVWPKSQKLLK